MATPKKSAQKKTLKKAGMKRVKGGSTSTTSTIQDVTLNKQKAALKSAQVDDAYIRM